MRIFLIHGWDGSPAEPMHIWLKDNLTKLGFDFFAPDMPRPSNPKVQAWVREINEVVIGPNEQTYFIGHSMGCQAILRYLESQPDKIKVGGVFMIAPWMFLDDDAIAEEGKHAVAVQEEWEATAVEWENVKDKTKEFVCQFSDNDPFVPIENENIFVEHLDADIIVEENKGHFTEADGVTENQTVVEWFSDKI